MTSAWCDTRLLIVDKCSFASSEVFKQICENAQILKTADYLTFDYFCTLNLSLLGIFLISNPCVLSLSTKVTTVKISMVS
jgi:hypothetical protein